jgi:hypothetical protein
MNILGPWLLLALSGHVKAWWGGQTQQQSGSFASSQSHASSHSSASASGYGAATNPPGKSQGPKIFITV